MGPLDFELNEALTVMQIALSNLEFISDRVRHHKKLNKQFDKVEKELAKLYQMIGKEFK